MFAVNTAQVVVSDSFMFFVIVKPSNFISLWYLISTMGFDLSQDLRATERDLWVMIEAPVAFS